MAWLLSFSLRFSSSFACAEDAESRKKSTWPHRNPIEVQLKVTYNMNRHSHHLEVRQEDSVTSIADFDQGFYRGKSVDTPLPQHAPLDESLLAREDCVNGFVAAKHDRSAPDPVTGPAEMEGRPIYPTGTVGPVPVEMEAAPIMAPKTPMSPVVDESPVLGRHHSGAHAAQRHSNLMDDIRRRQHSRHIMSWNNYDDRSAISPPASMMTMSPRIGSPDVSPMLDQRSSSKSPPAHPN